MFQIEKDGPAVINSNFWDNKLEHRGCFFLSFNAGAAGLLVPDNRLGEVVKMQTGKLVIPRDITEILFDDDTDTPYSTHIAHVDRLFPVDRDPSFTAWTRGSVLVFEKPAKFRLVTKLPYLRHGTTA